MPFDNYWAGVSVSVIPVTHANWRARLYLRYGPRRGQTRLLQREQFGPLLVQRPFQAEAGVCHTYLLHPPGGVVGGDQLQIIIAADSGAHSLVTTPGAGKFYRSGGQYAAQQLQLQVADGALLEWLPQETLFFPGACARLETRIELVTGARFIGWEMLCFGRPVLKERFSHGDIRGRSQIYLDGELRLSEGLFVQQAGNPEQLAGLQTYPMQGNCYVFPADAQLLALVRQALSAFAAGTSDFEYGATLVDDILCIRLLGHQTEVLMTALIAVWQQIHQHWHGRLPQPPRIWAT